MLMSLLFSLSLFFFLVMVFLSLCFSFSLSVCLSVCISFSLSHSFIVWSLCHIVQCDSYSVFFDFIPCNLTFILSSLNPIHSQSYTCKERLQVKMLHCNTYMTTSLTLFFFSVLVCFSISLSLSLFLSLTHCVVSFPYCPV